MVHLFVKESTLCSKLYDILSKRIETPEDTIAKLKGKNVLIGKNHEQARVIGIKNRTVYYELVHQAPTIIFHNKKKTGSFYVHNLIAQQKNSTDFKAYPHEPTRILVSSGKHVSMSFQRQDSNLEAVLERGIGETKRIQSENELHELTNWVYKSRKYENEMVNSIKNIDYYLSIGEVWKQFGAVCRHFSGVLYALLLLQSVDAKLVSSNKEIVKHINRSHVFLEVTFSKNTYIVDPTWNFVTPKEDLIKTLRYLKKETLLHQDYQQMKFYPYYSK